MTERVDPETAMKMATDIIVAFLGKRSIEPEQLPDLVARVRTALTGNSDAAAFPLPEYPPAVSGRQEAATLTLSRASLEPAVPVEQSIFPDRIISLEDGRPYRSLRRHLMARYGLSPEAYRAKWGLPADYPMVAPDYAAQRSEVAKRIGLGRAGAEAKRATAQSRRKSAADTRTAATK